MNVGLRIDPFRTETLSESSNYVPRAAERRSETGLCLSGGGYRAALFHLGALRRLNELGVLSQVDTISSVSGGSILSAHLAARVDPWPARGQVYADWDKKVAEPFYQFVSQDIRTGPVLKRLLPWNWFRATTQVKALAANYRRLLTAQTLHELPQHPRFTFCATDLVFGVNWIFERERVGDYQAGYLAPAPSWPVADAVAASSCVPPVFDSWIPRIEPGQLEDGAYPSGPQRDQLVASIRLTDGGVYDNLGTEPVWKDHRVVMVSDGGAVFPFEASKTPLRRIGRNLAVISNQAVALRKRWLISSFISKHMEGTYWGIDSDTASYPQEKGIGYSEELIGKTISRVRTDLNRFTEAEIAVLENHGYLLATAAVKSYLSDLVSVDKAPAVPHEEWMDEERVAEALRNSHKRCVLRW
jgi:NTE family protein